MNRRFFLSSLGATAITSFAGCGQPSSGRDRDTAIESTRQETATPKSSKIPLPGDPVRTQNTALEIQNVSGLFESESRGFDGDPEEYEFETEPQASFERSGVDTRPDDNSANLEVSADHVGTGRAFGLATGSFQTAWEAPATGQYILSSRYSRHADILYDHPDNGRISTSFDTSLLATRHREGKVLSKRTHPELQHKNGGLREELSEWFISKGVSYLVGTALGLGLVARIVLGQIIGNLVELDQNIGNRGSEIYDVYHRVQPNYEDPIQLTTEFEATEGDIFIFELTPTLGFGFELQNSWRYQPTSIASFDAHPFHIERLG